MSWRKYTTLSLLLVITLTVLESTYGSFTFDSNPGLMLRVDEKILQKTIEDGLKGIPLGFSYDLDLPEKMEVLIELPFKNNTLHISEI